MDDHLRAAVGLRLQQHRVEVRPRRNAGRPRLHRLRPPDLAPVRAGRGVVRHVLRLERRHAHAPPPRRPAQTRDHHRLPRVGPRPLDHEHPRSNALLPYLHAVTHQKTLPHQRETHHESLYHSRLLPLSPPAGRPSLKSPSLYSKRPALASIPLNRLRQNVRYDLTKTHPFRHPCWTPRRPHSHHPPNPVPLSHLG